MNRCNSVVMVLTLVAGFAIVAEAGKYPFRKENEIRQTKAQRHVSLVDLDQDGDIDVLVMEQPSGGPARGRVKWHENRAGGKKFVERGIDDTLMEPDDALVADIDGDGDLDVVATGNGRHAEPNGGLQWWENVGKAKVWENHHIHHNGPHGELGAGDVDGDGDLDVVIGSNLNLGWYENVDGKGRAWSDRNIIAEDDYHTKNTPVLVHDYDGDGDVDVIAGNRSSEEFLWFENDDAEFTRHVIRTGGGANPNSLATVDFDGDGDLDLVVGAKRQIAVYENLGQGRYAPEEIVNSLNVNKVYTARASDVDGDGDTDIIGTSQELSEHLMWFENKDGDFEMHVISASRHRAKFLDVADIDGDGDPDVVCNKDLSFSVRWWENEFKKK